MKFTKNIERLSLIAFLALGLIVSAGCLDEIDFAKAGKIDDSIAIQGKIVKANPSFVNVTIRSVFNFQDAARLINVREVTVEDESGNKVELESNADGVFFLEIADNDPNFKVDYGKSYKINVSTFDGRNYSSSFDELQPAPVPDAIKATRTEIETVDVNGNSRIFDQITYTVDSPLKAPNSSVNARILWELISTYRLTDSPESYGQRACFPTRIEEFNKTCYITSSPVTNYLTLDGTELSAERVDNYELISTGLTPLYAEGFYMAVLQQSLSEEAYAYWAQVGTVVDRTGDLFQAPAGKVITNIVNTDDEKEDVFGYFYATEETVRRVFVSPEFAGNPNRTCPAQPTEGGQAPNDCCDCLTAGKSTRIQPEWWVD